MFPWGYRNGTLMLNGLSEVKRQPLKMVKQTQTIRRTFADKLFERV